MWVPVTPIPFRKSVGVAASPPFNTRNTQALFSPNQSRAKTTTMQTQLTDRNLKTAGETSRLQTQSPFLRITESQSRCRKARVSFSPRRESCLTRRALLAALREAEFAEWMNSGGDFLDSMHQPVH